jgi:hypothetical protein
MTVEAPTVRGPWTMRVTNDGDVPVRIAADARLVVLDVTPRGASKAVRCELPADMRAGDDAERALVVPPKRSYTESLEPRLYCFSRGQLDALAPGAVVVGHLGWPGRTAASPPFAAAPIDGVEPPVAPLKAIDAAPIVLPDEPTPQVVPTAPARAEDDVPHLVLSGTATADAAVAEAIEIPLTLRNESSRAVTLRFRPDTLSFDVTGPLGVQTCTWPAILGAPTREIFTTLPPKAATNLSVVLTAYCGGHMFDQGGLFVVRPRLDTTKASGASIGLRTFDGVVRGASPTVVRLHRGTAPVVSLRRPRLEPE